VEPLRIQVGVAHRHMQDNDDRYRKISWKPRNQGLQCLRPACRYSDYDNINVTATLVSAAAIDLLRTFDFSWASAAETNASGSFHFFDKIIRHLKDLLCR